MSTVTETPQKIQAPIIKMTEHDQVSSGLYAVVMLLVTGVGLLIMVWVANMLPVHKRPPAVQLLEEEPGGDPHGFIDGVPGETLALGSPDVDASDPAGAVSSAVATMCRQALARSGLKAGDIDLVKLQAAGSPHNDATELAGLRLAFERLPALVSLKGWIGHTLGAAGAAEIALLLACIEADVWPAPNYPLDRTLEAGLADSAPPRLRHLLASILGFGGGHAAVVLGDTGASR